MSYGILVNSSGGFTQIDATYDNLAVYASGTVNSSYVNAAGTGGATNKVAFPANTPADWCIFAKPTTESGDHLLTLAHYSDGTGFAFFNTWQNSTVISVSWVIAVRSRDMPTNNNPDFGLEVNKSNGEQAFSSNNLNFRCEQVSFDTIVNTQTSLSSFSVSDMAGVYSLMNGKTILGAAPSGNQFYSILYSFFSRFEYTPKTIRGFASPVALASYGATGQFGGGTKTNLIGRFK